MQTIIPRSECFVVNYDYGKVLEKGEREMIIRRYRPSDLFELAELFYETVHAVNVRDYTKEQLDAWATGQVDLERWERTLSEHHTLVAAEDEKIVGFGDMDLSGYLDRLFVHKDRQRRGIATALCDRLEEAVRADRYTVHASVTARPFFLFRGYRVVKEQQVIRRGVALTNYVMEKKI